MKTKEKMIADIRRVVIMANNPKCKTYDEVLAKEIKDNNYVNDCKVIMLNGDIKIMPYYLLLKNTNLIQYGKYEFLGLPLTLERVLVALNSNQSYIFISDGYAIFRVIPPAYELDLCKICDWAPNKTLDNQSQETIETIYKKLIS
jgi:hypothetical protein